MEKENFFEKCPYCGCQLLSVIKPRINGNAIVKGIPKRRRELYCPDCKIFFYRVGRINRKFL